MSQCSYIVFSLISLAARLQRSVVFVTWSGQAVLPGGVVVVKCQQHDVHGEDKHPRQKQVEDQVKEQDEAWWGGREQDSFYHTVKYTPPPLSTSSPQNVIFLILLC